MSFTIYQADGSRYQQWFSTIGELISSMKRNPNDAYHRND